MLDLRGSTFEPAGIMSSVVILLPNFNKTSASITLPKGFFIGTSFIFGPFIIFMLSVSFLGGIMNLSLIQNRSGAFISAR